MKFFLLCLLIMVYNKTPLPLMSWALLDVVAVVSNWNAPFSTITTYHGSASFPTSLWNGYSWKLLLFSRVIIWGWYYLSLNP